jgi:predicted enzyme related to lactoylglutathione lyase
MTVDVGMERLGFTLWEPSWAGGGDACQARYTVRMGSTMVTFYVEVEDLEAALQKAEAQGAKRVMGPEDVPGGPSIAMFSDPDGNVIGLTKARSMG